MIGEQKVRNWSKKWWALSSHLLNFGNKKSFGNTAHWLTHLLLRDLKELSLSKISNGEFLARATVGTSLYVSLSQLVS